MTHEEWLEMWRGTQEYMKLRCYRPNWIDYIHDSYMCDFRGMIITLDRGYGDERYFLDIDDGTSRILRYTIADELSDDEYAEEFVRVLERKMWIAGLFQKDLCERSGLSEVTVSKLLNGKSIPKFATIRKLARGLGCSADELVRLY